MRRERDELEDALDVAGVEAGVEQPLRRAAADEPLRARARVDPDRLDADDAAHAVARRRGDADERHHLLRREPGDRRAALVRVARRMRTSASERALPLDDPARDVLGEVLDEERLVLDDAFDRLLEQLGEARHVHALLRRIEVDGAVDRRRDQLLARAAPDAHRLLHAGDAGARKADRDLRGRRPAGPRAFAIPLG